MIDFEQIKTIVFDYDGTLHDSIKLYGPAFRRAYEYLVRQGLAKQRSWSDKEISIWLGYNSQDMWNRFMPELSKDIKELCSNIIGEEMKRLVEAGKSELYEGALETLEYLKNKGYVLVFLSNCKEYYKAAHTKTFQLDRYFQVLVCSEEHDYIPKHEILRKLRSSFPEKLVIIGDRAQDIEAGVKNNIYSIGCSYGYAVEDELKEADMLIKDITELKNYF